MQARIESLTSDDHKPPTFWPPNTAAKQSKGSLDGLETGNIV